MDWFLRAKTLFNIQKPVHFTDYLHCEECDDHDRTLLGHDVDSIGFSELGSPAWDPMCFVTVEGFMYYFPSMVRLCLVENELEYYISQFLFHISYDGKNNRYVMSFNHEQKTFFINFLNYLMDTKSEILDRNMDSDDLFNALEIWTQ